MKIREGKKETQEAKLKRDTIKIYRVLNFSRMKSFFISKSISQNDFETFISYII